jgi:amidohydrolase
VTVREMESAERRRLIETRRDLHRHPELGFEERRTAGIVAERLGAAGYEVRTGVAETGVVGDLAGGAGDGPTLMIRADMDALPIAEETEHDYRSTVNGVMHACGHDGHVAVGLAVAERLAARRDGWPGRVRMVFQPAEEGLGGARRMVEEGVLDGVDAALGLHLWLGLPSGSVTVLPGSLMAASTTLRITLHGRGGHGAIPHEAVDAVVLAAQVVTALQTVVSRSVAPLDTAVVTIGSVEAGSAPNVIAERAVLDGSMRAFDPAVMEMLRERVTAIAEGVAAAGGGRAEVDFLHEIPVTANDPAVTELVRNAAAEVVGEGRVLTDPARRTLASEDMGEFLQRLPGCYFFVGASNRETGAIHPHHSPRFEICEDAMPVAVRVMEAAALRMLLRTEGSAGSA